MFTYTNRFFVLFNNYVSYVGKLSRNQNAPPRGRTHYTSPIASEGKGQISHEDSATVAASLTTVALVYF